MKHLLIFLIKIYQKIPGPWHNMCRHIPTCSNYGIEAIDEYGSIKGTYLTIKRIIKCNPWGTYGYDPVPKKEKTMKNKLFCLLLIISILLTTGCIKRDEMDNINILTTIYPIEYVTKRLYGSNSKITSIYPNGANINNYTFTKKQLKDFSSKDLFIYNGESKEKEFATTMLNKNKNLKIIDAAYGLDVTYSETDIWLNPANVLMIAQNIKNELKDYMSNPYLKKEIENQYQLLKIDISEIETELKRTADNSSNKTIISSDESLKFLTKYGFEIINLMDNNKKNENNINLAKSLLNNETVTYVFVNENTNNNDFINSFITETGAKKLLLKNFATITDDDLNKNEDYLSIMNTNISNLKEETYK